MVAQASTVDAQGVQYLHHLLTLLVSTPHTVTFSLALLRCCSWVLLPKVQLEVIHQNQQADSTDQLCQTLVIVDSSEGLKQSPENRINGSSSAKLFICTAKILQWQLFDFLEDGENRPILANTVN